MNRYNTFAEMFLQMEKGKSTPTALNDRQKDGSWVSVSTEQMHYEIKCISLGLLELGVSPGDMVGLLALPSSKWSIADMAMLLMRIVDIPLFPNVSEANFLFEVELTEQKVIFVSGEEPWQLIKKHHGKFKTIIAMDEAPEGIDVIGWKELVAKGEQVLKAEPNRFYDLLNEVSEENVATIIFTSGTTGVPKGAVHTHKSLGANNTYNQHGWGFGDIYLNILPLAHVFGRVLNYILIGYGVSVYYLNEILLFRHICPKVKPTVLVIVPRLLEKMYAGINNKINNSTGIKKILGQAAISLATDPNPPFYKALLRPLFDKLVYHKFREIVGGRVRIVICGGATLEPEIGHFFNNVGIPTYEGWGMTESNIGTANYPGHQKIRSVGPVVAEDIELKLTDDSELLFRYIGQMKEYYKNPEMTAETITEDGWIRTGDVATIDEDGYLTIVRRSKELYKTSTGEYIAPLPIEDSLKKHPLVEMAMVVGDGEKFASCLLFPDVEAVELWKKEKGMEEMSTEEFLKNGSVRESVSQHIEEFNKDLNHWEKIKAFQFIPLVPSVQGGELTPTMKLRREPIVEKYQDVIRGMYDS